MLCEKLVQSASLYSHRITRINALQGRLVWERIRDETEGSLLNTVGGGASSNSNLACICMSKCRCILLLKLSMNVIYEHVHAHVWKDLCMQRLAEAGNIIYVGECVCVRACVRACVCVCARVHW